MKSWISWVLILSALLGMTGCAPGGQSSAGSTAVSSFGVRTEEPGGATSSAPAPAASSAVEPAGSASVTQEPPAEPETDPQPNDSYFDNALFIGDSIMEGIRQYVTKQRKNQTTLGKAKFLATTIGITLADLVGDSQSGNYYSYKGEEKPLEQIVSGIAPERIFLLLGLNDLAAADPVVEQSVDRYSRLVDLLRTAVPGVEIIVITNPPKVASNWLPSYTQNRKFNNELIGRFVQALMQMCQEREIPCVDAHTALENESGVLPEDYCRDGYVHLNDAGAAVVVDALYAFAADKP